MSSIITAAGIAALKAGDKAQARVLLLQAVKDDPNDELAWLWLSGSVELDGQRRDALERVLAINPANEGARKGLALLPPSSSPSPLPSPLPEALISQQQVDAAKKCPYCAETIKAEAVICRFCGKDLSIAAPQVGSTSIPEESQEVLTLSQVTSSLGGPQKTKKSNPLKTILLLLIVLSCGFIYFLGDIGSKSNNSAENSRSPVVAPVAVIEPTAELAPGIGSTVQVGATEWYVTDAFLTDALTGDTFSARPSGIFLVVEARVTNGGDQAESLVSPKTLDADGREYEVSGEADVILANDRPCVFERLNPGATKTCRFVYDIPAGNDGSGWSLQADELGIFGETATIALQK
ncbi:DUF4352 domain-containing protein [Chloroflexales bacterium ZM16-3]|nr:DUF4352 domain-containing protein [Chloroflexales bacterium ZM16-3]